MDSLPMDCIQYGISRFLYTPYINTQLNALSDHIIKWNNTGQCDLTPDYYLLKHFLPEYSLEQIYTYISDYKNLSNVSANIKSSISYHTYDIDYFLKNIYNAIILQNKSKFSIVLYNIRTAVKPITHCNGGCIKCHKHLPYWWPSAGILTKQKKLKRWNKKTNGFIKVGFCSPQCHYTYTKSHTILPYFECKECRQKYKYTDLDSTNCSSFCSIDCFDEYYSPENRYDRYEY